MAHPIEGDRWTHPIEGAAGTIGVIGTTGPPVGGGPMIRMVPRTPVQPIQMDPLHRVGTDGGKMRIVPVVPIHSPSLFDAVLLPGAGRAGPRAPTTLICVSSFGTDGPRANCGVVPRARGDDVVRHQGFLGPVPTLRGRGKKAKSFPLCDPKRWKNPRKRRGRKKGKIPFLEHSLRANHKVCDSAHPSNRPEMASAGEKRGKMPKKGENRAASFPFGDRRKSFQRKDLRCVSF
jgi:hypothetical protein